MFRSRFQSILATRTTLLAGLGAVLMSVPLVRSQHVSRQTIHTVRKPTRYGAAQRRVQVTFLRSFKTRREDVESLVFSPNGQVLVSGGENNWLQFWDWRTGRQINMLKRELSSTYNFAFSPDGKYFAAGTSEIVGVAVWETRTGKLLRILREPYPQSKGAHVCDFDFSPDGKTLAANPCSRIQLWDVASGKLLRKSPARDPKVYRVLFMPDGRRVIAASGDCDGEPGSPAPTVRVYDTQSATLVRSVSDTGWPVCFSPRGDLITEVIQNFENRESNISLRRWNPRSNKSVPLSVSGLTAYGGAESIDFSPDGKVMATGHKDKTIKLWNARTGQLLQTLPGHSKWVLSVAFSPDGRTLASGDMDGTIRLWSVTPLSSKSA